MTHTDKDTTTKTENPSTHAHENQTLRTSILSLLTIGILAAIFSYIFKSIGISNIQKYIDDMGLFGAVVFILVDLFTIIVPPISGSVLLFSSGTLFGFWKGMLVSGFSGILGSTINFWIARKWGTPVILKMVGKKGLKQIGDLAQKVLERNIFFLIFLMSTGAFDFVAYAIGLTTMKYRKFLISSIISTCINVPLYIYFGSSLIENNEILIGVYLILGAFALGYFGAQFLDHRYTKILQKA